MSLFLTRFSVISLRRWWDSVTLATYPWDAGHWHTLPCQKHFLQRVCASKITQDDSKLQIHCKAGISSFPSFPWSPSRLSEELTSFLTCLPHCILTARLCSNLGWCFLGQLSLMECPRVWVLWAPITQILPRRQEPPRSGGFAASQNLHSQHCLWRVTWMSRSSN